MSTKTYIIAEAGVNHNGSLDMAKELVKVAKEAGVDAVKFQTFRAENLVTTKAKQADYQVENLGASTSQYEMLKSLELSFNEFEELKIYCDSLNIEFLSTPFDIESVDFLLDELEMQTIKIPSGELTNTPFIHYIAKKKKNMIVSTGMATMDEIHEALSYIAFGLVRPNEKVTMENVHNFYQTSEAKEVLASYVSVLHCTTEYPAPFDTINLTAMHQLSNELKLPIGFSDHSAGISIPIAAVSLGATVIEKHFTLDRNLPGPDHKASLEPAELNDMVKGIKEVEQALGNGLKQPTMVEMGNRIAARKSLVAGKPIKAGEPFTIDNLAVKRPGSGMSPLKYWDLLGFEAKKSYEKDELIDE